MKNNLKDWDSNDIINWIKKELEFKDYDYDIIKRNNLNGLDLIDLTEDNLKYDLKILNLHDRKILLRKICEMMKNIIDVNKNSDNHSNSINNNAKFNVKRININYNGKLVSFKCGKSNKMSCLLDEYCNIFNLNKGVNLLITDKNKCIIPKESLIHEVANDNETFNLENKLEKNIELVKNSSQINESSKTNNITSKYLNTSISDTAIKNKYLSFEALDNFENNGYTFSIKKNKDILDKEKFTFNSYYRISNLNNFNNDLSYINQTPNNNKNISSGIGGTIVETKSNLNAMPTDDQILNKENDKKLDTDEYIGRLISSKYSNSISLNNLSCNSGNSDKSVKLYDKKNQYFHKLNNYYKDAKKIKEKKNITNKDNLSSQRENEIENFLKSMKKSSTFVLPSESADSKLKTYIQESKKNKNTMKSNLRHLIHQNITSSISNEKNIDNSISN